MLNYYKALILHQPEATISLTQFEFSSTKLKSITFHKRNIAQISKPLNFNNTERYVQLTKM